MLLDRRLRCFGAELLDVGRDAERLDFPDLELALVAPVEKLFHRVRVSHARVAVADVGGEELDETAPLARSPWALIMDGSASRPARISAQKRPIVITRCYVQPTLAACK